MWTGRRGSSRPTTRQRRRALPEREAGPEVDYAERFSRPRRTRFKGLFDKLAVLALPLLLLALIAQAAFHFRDALAAHVPATKPTLVKACALAGLQRSARCRRRAACRSTRRTCRPIRRIADC